MSVYQNLSDTQKFACRVIADHARSTAFAITDGILPGNEGRNYVLRKIMRRAIYHGREHLGFSDLFFYKVCDKVVDQMKDAYPELEAQRGFITKMVRLEEERFASSLTVGLKNFPEAMSKLKKNLDEKLEPLKDLLESTPNSSELLNIDFTPLRDFLKNDKNFSVNLRQKFEPLQEIVDSINSFNNDLKFQLAPLVEIINSDWLPKEQIKELAKLNDTFGLPKDLIRVKAEEVVGRINEDKFDESFDIAITELQQSNSVGKTTRKSEISPIYAEILEQAGANDFVGYDVTSTGSAKVTALVKDEKLVDALNEGDEGLIVLNTTPFYAESGGQVGDTGELFADDTKIKVFDTFAPISGVNLHKSKVVSGKVAVGDLLSADVDVEKRDATRRNHTATHLVHAALREVLGTHVKQAGSVVAPGYLRFDFTHYQPMSEAEITEIEDLVNAHILQNETVNTDVMSIEDAMRTGAMALFGEKYGSKVRVLSVGGGEFSRELCGGTHVRATGDIGSFKITADEAIASGVRRIRAITGFDAFARFREDERLIDRSLGALKTQRDNLPNAIERLQDELKKARRENDELKLKIATGAAGSGGDAADDVRDVNGIKVIAKTVDGLDKGGMRHLSDTLMAKLKSGVVVLGKAEDDKVAFIVRVSDDLTDKVKAGKIIQEIAPIVGGKGGGRPDMAEGGGTDASKLGDAIDASLTSIKNMA